MSSRPWSEPRQALGLTIRTISLSSGEIAYVDEGAGPPVLLLHGAPITAIGFVRVIRELKAHHRVIAPDLPGFGGSSRSSGFSGSLESHSGFVVELCRALGLRRFFMCVNDASGCFGLHAAAGVAAEVRGIIVASTAPLPLTGLAAPVKFILKHLVGSRLVRFLNRRFNLLPWLVATVAPWLRPFSAAERAALTAPFGTPEKRDRIIDLFSAMGRDEAFMRAAATRAGHALADKPVLLLYGQLDPMRLIGAVRRFRRLFPRSVARIIALEEHFPILASGRRVGQIVHRWITDLGQDARG
jgi:haloalkane dehalogenase